MMVQAKFSPLAQINSCTFLFENCRLLEELVVLRSVNITFPCHTHSFLLLVFYKYATYQNLISWLAHKKALRLLICLPLFMGVLCRSLFWYALRCVITSFAIILTRKRESWLLCFDCLSCVLLMWIFLTVPWVGLQCVIVVFPDHTHLLSGLYSPISVQ